MPNDLIDELLAGYQMLDDLIGENGLLKQLTKALVERALLATWPHNSDTINIRLSSTAGTAHNGKSNKTLKGEFGELPIEILRDRDGRFEPQQQWLTMFAQNSGYARLASIFIFCNVLYLKAYIIFYE